MDVGFLLCLLVALGADAGPTGSLDLLTRAIERRHGDCESLTILADAALQYSLENDPYDPYETPAFKRELHKRQVGLDIYEPTELEKIICRLNEATTLSELKAGLQELGIYENYMTYRYNLGVVVLPLIVQRLGRIVSHLTTELEKATITAILQTIRILRGSHLLGFDPEGTEWARENLQSGVVWNDTAEVIPPESLCDVLGNSINDAIQIAMLDDQQVTDFATITGINLNDAAQVRDTTCRFAAVTSIEEAFSVGEELGILNKVFVYAYGRSVEYLHQSIRECEDRLEQYDDTDDFPESYYTYVQFLWNEAAVYLSFYEATEAHTDFCSLPNDLTE